MQIVGCYNQNKVGEIMKNRKIYKLNFRDDCDQIEYSFAGCVKSAIINTPHCQYRKDKREKSSVLQERCRSNKAVSRIRHERNMRAAKELESVVAEHVAERESYFQSLEFVF